MRNVFVSTVESASMLLGSLQNIFFCVPEVEEKKRSNWFETIWVRKNDDIFIFEWVNYPFKEAVCN